jgi:hypothetical protein
MNTVERNEKLIVRTVSRKARVQAPGQGAFPPVFWLLCEACPKGEQGRGGACASGLATGAGGLSMAGECKHYVRHYLPCSTEARDAVIECDFGSS